MCSPSMSSGACEVTSRCRCGQERNKRPTRWRADVTTSKLSSTSSTCRCCNVASNASVSLPNPAGLTSSPVLSAETTGFRIGGVRQFHEEGAVDECIAKTPCCGIGEPRLTDAAHPGQRDQPMLLDGLHQRRDLALAPDERGRKAQRFEPHMPGRHFRLLAGVERLEN